jgi:hypothetical protein
MVDAHVTSRRMPAMKSVGERSAGNPHAAFDERGGETERLCGTAPLLDSTSRILRGAPPPFAEFLTRAPHSVDPDNAHGRLLRANRWFISRTLPMMKPIAREIQFVERLSH